jgi:hypothetical protein
VLGLLNYTPELGMRHTLAAGSVPFVSLNSACMADAACLVTQPRADMASPVQVRSHHVFPLSLSIYI